MLLLSPRARTGLSWLAQLVAAAILGMAGLSKLSSAPDSVALFTRLGVEPWGRYLLGAVELLTALLLLWPKSAVVGGVLGMVLMLGAIATHLFRIGITYGGDPSLFLMATVVLLASAATITLRRGH
jgi:putative oxidoreductase